MPEAEAVEAKRVAPPKSGNGWEVLDVEGGWLRFSKNIGRLDGHCKRHGIGCKMDRTLRRGTLGLTLAWLADTVADTKEDHDMFKVFLSAAEGFDRRESARARFVSAASGGLAQTILDCERELREGAADEPRSLACGFRG